MDFVAWLDANVLPSKRYSSAKVTAQTIILRETDSNVNMKLEIRKVSDQAIILRPDQMGQWRVLKDETETEWWSRCDFLMIGENAGGLFAIFMEFKKSVPDPYNKANEQLRWSLPLLHFLLSVYNVDNFSSIGEEDFTIRYFQIGQPPNKIQDKLKAMIDLSRLFTSDEYKGITVNHYVAPKVTLKELLQESA